MKTAGAASGEQRSNVTKSMACLLLIILVENCSFYRKSTGELYPPPHQIDIYLLGFSGLKNTIHVVLSLDLSCVKVVVH